MISVLGYVYSFHSPNPFLDFIRNAIDDHYEKYDSTESQFINKNVEWENWEIMEREWNSKQLINFNGRNRTNNDRNLSLILSTRIKRFVRCFSLVLKVIV